MFLLLILYAVIGTSLAGIFMVAALTMGMTTATPVVYSALAGFVVAVPVVWIVAKKLRT